MKKLTLTTLIIFCISIFLFCAPAGAVLDGTGPCSSSTDAQYWLHRYSAQARVEGGDKAINKNAPDGLLTGNYAFANTSQYAWVRDKKVDMGKKAYVRDNDMYIPTDFAKKCFGVDADGEYISISALAEEKEYYSFFEPVGFALLSETENAVNISNTAKYGYSDFYTVLEAIGTLTWQDVSENEFDAKAFINNWRKLLTISEEHKNDADYSSYLSNLQKKAPSLFGKLNFSTTGNAPFTDLELQAILDADGEDDAFDRHTPKYTTNLVTAYERLVLMAQYYKSVKPDDNELRSQLIEAIEYLYDNHYSKPLNFKLYYNAGDSKGSWTAYQLELPREYAKLLCIMYDELGAETVKKHANAILDRTIDPTTRLTSDLHEYYSNRIWRTEGFFAAAVLANDYTRMNYAMRYLNQIFMVVPNEFNGLNYPSNGFYEDGSMIFHTSVAYNHGYGDSYLSSVAEMLELTKNTPFSIQKVYGYENIYMIMEKCFFPFAVENSRMHFVSGRANVSSAAAAFCAMVNIIANAPDEKKEGLVKGLKTGYYTYLGNYINIEALSSAEDVNLMSCAENLAMFKGSRDEIWNLAEAEAPAEKAMMFHNMDRAMQLSDNYAVCLAMSSGRVQKYECIIPQNNKGWYTGDGMLYVYLGDQMQYTSSYFSEYDPYRVPGTTVDETVRSEITTTSTTMPDNNFAGGAADSQTAICGYTLSTAPLDDVKNGIQISGNKSYFMLNGKIICVGSNITGGEGNVCTVIDNRRINLAETE